MLMQRFQSKGVRGACQGMRRYAATQAPQMSLDRFFDRILTTRNMKIYAFVGANLTMQYLFGEEQNFFMGKFTTKKHPDDLAEFYQAEDLLKIIAIHPILFHFFMNKVETCDEPEEGQELLVEGETQFRVKNLGMDVAFEIITEEEEDENGEAKLKYFNRHERFIDNIPLLPDLGINITISHNGETWSRSKFGLMLWDQVWNFGFKAISSDTYEVFHQGEYFRGPWPIRFIVFFHQYYVIWACERVVNGENFGVEDRFDAVHEEMSNVPLHVFKGFLANLRKQKEKNLQELTSAEKPDSAAIDHVTDTIRKIDSLALRNQASIALVRRPGGTGSIQKSQRVKIIAKDRETQQVLTSAMGNNMNSHVAAFQEAAKTSDLQFMKSQQVIKSVPQAERAPNLMAMAGASRSPDAPTVAEVELPGKVASTSLAEMYPQQAAANLAHAVQSPATAVKLEVPKKSDSKMASMAEMTPEQREVLEMMMREADILGKKIDIPLSPSYL